MKIIKPYFQILSKINSGEILRNIERTGRVCYKSEDKITEDSAEKFVQMLINKGHESVLEHEKISVLFVCDRGVSHELVRHRLASFSQESTRYCDYSKKNDGEIVFIQPSWVTDRSIEIMEALKCNFPPSIPETDGVWYRCLQEVSYRYKKLLKEGWTPQQARTVLPNSLKTEIVVTANLREWRLILRQRTSKAAHPQMRELMCPLLEEFKQSIPVIFNDINV